MKPLIKLQLLIILLLSIVSLSVQSDSLDAESPDLARLFDQKNAGRILLVTFKDQSINRVQQSTATSYRRRGDYSSSTWSQRLSQKIADDHHVQKLTEWPMSAVGVHCVVYEVPANIPVAHAVQDIARDERVEVVQNMNVFNTRAYRDDSGSTTDPYFQLQSNLYAMQIDQAHAKATGKNVTIAIIDTGVDLKHPDLMGQIIENTNFASNVSADFSHDKHGTAVAGIIAAKKDNGTGITGIAPDANIIAFKACWPNHADAMEAICNSFTLAMAINAAIRSDAKILNMSLTGPHDPILELLLNKAIEKGMIVVAATTDVERDTANFPASLKGVISVQSDKQINTKIAGTLTAPGEKILTTLPYGTYDFISGSSIAAAEVSGVIALLLELKPDLTLTEAQILLKKSILPEKISFFPGINAHVAMLNLCETTECPQKNLAMHH